MLSFGTDLACRAGPCPSGNAEGSVRPLGLTSKRKDLQMAQTLPIKVTAHTKVTVEGKLVWKEKTKYLPFPIFDDELQNAIAAFGARKAYELMYDQFKIVEQAPIAKEIGREYGEKTDGNGGSKNGAAKREDLEARVT